MSGKVPIEKSPVEKNPLAEKLPIEKRPIEKNLKAEIKDKLEKEKPERKELKNEAKELKIEKLEVKELKREKIEQKELKLEVKEHAKSELEVPVDPQIPDPGPFAGGPPLPTEQLAAHADALEQAAKQLRHFIAESERPDLRQGGLENEDDQQGG